jgi:deoxycytidylate deaminase
MYQAFAAAGNSACLSRQVGAAITNSNGDILGVGWNDVPRAMGGVYTYSDKDPLSEQDFRCLNLEGGKCFNDFEKELIRNQLVEVLIAGGIIDTANKEQAISLIKKSRIKELIEFSRAVHAEMLAIITSSQKAGTEVLNGKLFCTTYPCHNCARHIVAAGLKEVYYIEPYRKSLALKLHDDSISEKEDDVDKVRILMFDGVSPKRYLELFKMTLPRKENGKMTQINKRNRYPKITLSLQAIPLLEKEIIKELQSKQLISIGDEKEA